MGIPVLIDRFGEPLYTIFRKCVKCNKNDGPTFSGLEYSIPPICEPCSRAKGNEKTELLESNESKGEGK